MQGTILSKNILPAYGLAIRVLVTGEIPRTNSFEKGFPNHYSEVEEGKMEADPLIKDDQAIILRVKDKGLVIITGYRACRNYKHIKLCKRIDRGR